MLLPVGFLLPPTVPQLRVRAYCSMSQSFDADVLVVGGGASGIFSSIAAARAGANVIILDSGAQQRREGAPLCGPNGQNEAVIGVAWVVESAGNRWWMESTAPQSPLTEGGLPRPRVVERGQASQLEHGGHHVDELYDGGAFLSVERGVFVS